MIFDFSLEPIVNFENLLKLAQAKGVRDANAMALATLGPEGMPSVRTVLFKGFLDGGFLFFTNYSSRKSEEIAANNKVAATFFWADLQQQVLLQGEVQKTTRQVSEDYFETRPRLSQLGAWASQQSQTVESLQILNQRLRDVEKKYEGQDVPCPPHWGGFRIEVSNIEFWFGKEGRLHERYLYTRKNKEWIRSYLSP